MSYLRKIVEFLRDFNVEVDDVEVQPASDGQYTVFLLPDEANQRPVLLDPGRDSVWLAKSAGTKWKDLGLDLNDIALSLIKESV